MIIWRRSALRVFFALFMANPQDAGTKRPAPALEAGLSPKRPPFVAAIPDEPQLGWRRVGISSTTSPSSTSWRRCGDDTIRPLSAAARSSTAPARRPRRQAGEARSRRAAVRAARGSPWRIASPPNPVASPPNPAVFGVAVRSASGH